MFLRICFKDIEVYEAHERKKELEVSQIRLEYIKLKNRLKKQETQLKQKASEQFKMQ